MTETARLLTALTLLLQILGTCAKTTPSLGDPDPTTTPGSDDPDPTTTPGPPADPDPTTTPGSDDSDPTTTTVALTTTTRSAVTSYCNVTLTAELTVKTFQTPNYPSNYDINMHCFVNIITTSVDHSIELEPETFTMEYDGYCAIDYVAVYDGNSASSSLLGQFCGTTFPNQITSSSQYMYVAMVSDSSFNYQGGQFKYIARDNSYPNCKAPFTTYTAAAAVQTFSSTGTTYSSNTDEYFLVDASAAGDLILQLTAMDVENARNCIYDRITIYNGGCTRYSTIATHCGKARKRWELSGTEYLVHFHSDGSVQRAGFTMQYYIGVSGTGVPTTTTTTLGPALATEVSLIGEVLTNYSTGNVPAKDLSSPVGSTVDLYFVGINDLDEVNQKLTSTMQFEIRWSDDFLSWPTNKKSGISQILIPQDDIWKPDFALLNGFESISQMGSSFMFVVVASDGGCTWKPYQILESVCAVDMTNYPYDTQSCELKFSTFSSSGNDVAMTLGDTGITKHDQFTENGEWTLVSINQRTVTEDGKAVAVFTITMKRNHFFSMFYIAVPIIMLSFMCAFTFAIPLASGEKSGFAMTVFLAFVVYVIVTYQKLPENSEDLSYFAIYILIMACVSGTAVMMVNLQARMMTLKTKNKPIAPCTRSLTKRIIALQNRWFFDKSNDQPSGPVNGANTRRSTRTKPQSKAKDVDEKKAWPDFVSALDFICFWVYLIVVSLLTFFFMIYLGVQ